MDDASGLARENVERAHRLRSLFVARPRLTLAAGESLTCGRLQAAVGAVSGASDFFIGGITAYTIAQKVRHLGVDAVAAQACHAVSPAIAAQMSVGTCRLFGSDFGVGTTGFAEPNPALGFPEPGAYWAVARSAQDRVTVIREGHVAGPELGRVQMQETVVANVLDALLECLAHLRSAESGAKHT